MAIRCHNH